MKKFSFITLLLLVTMLVTAILPSGNVLAADRGVTFTMYTPAGVILDRTPEFTWKKLTGITYYEVKVIQAGALVYDKIYDTCTTTTCSVTPVTTLGYKDFTWFVRAQGGTWSTGVDFVVSSPAFSSGFNGNMSGWAKFKGVGGTWKLEPTYVYTAGVAGGWSPFYRNASDGKYNDFDYTVRIRRYKGVYSGKAPANCLMARMGNYVDGKYFWYPGYRFCINTFGQYEIFYKGLGSTDSHVIKNWTYHGAINAGTSVWNTLRVRAVGDKFWFWINGTGVASFTDASKDRGYVGVMMYKYPTTATTYFDMDYAFLNVVVTSTADKAVLPVAAKLPYSEEDVVGSK